MDRQRSILYPIVRGYFTLYSFISLQMVLWHIAEYVRCHAHIFYLYKVDLRIHETGFGAYEDIIQGY